MSITVMHKNKDCKIRLIYQRMDEVSLSYRCFLVSQYHKAAYVRILQGRWDKADIIVHIFVATGIMVYKATLSSLPGVQWTTEYQGA